MIIKNKIKVAMLLVSFFALSIAQAQFNPFGGTTGQQNPFGDMFGAQDSVKKKAPTQSDGTKKADKTPKQENKDVDLKLSTEENRQDTVKHKWMELLNQIENKEEWSKTDSLIYKMTSRNLKLLLEKDNLILNKELKSLKKGQKNLPKSDLFGHSIFRKNVETDYRDPTQSQATQNYVLGPGDVVQIDVWGYSNFSANEEVSENGSIKLPNGNRVFVKGKTLAQAKKIIGYKIGRMVNLRNSDYSVIVTQTKNISVNITGEVFKPGTYTMSSNNTAYNALVNIGGPNNYGSVRNIYIRRNGKIVDKVDVYDFLSSPEKSKEVYLMDNDYIVVPTYQKVVKVAGSVRRIGKFELKYDEKLSDLIKFASGTKPTAYLKAINLVRIENAVYKNYSINYDSLLKIGQDLTLQDGDSIFFNEIMMDNLFTVKVEGAVNVPGMYKITKGDKISDVLRRANGPMFDADLSKAYIIRKNDDLSNSFIRFNVLDIINNVASETNIELKTEDVIRLFSKEEQAIFEQVSIYGEIKTPGSFQFAKNQRVSDLIDIANGLKPESYQNTALLVRTNLQTFEKQAIQVNLRQVLLNKNSTQNILLKPRDKLTIFTKDNLVKNYFVRIFGEVKKQDSIPFKKGMTLTDAILQSDGINKEAETNKIEIVSYLKLADDGFTWESVKPFRKVISINKNLLINDNAPILLNAGDRIFIRKAEFAREIRTAKISGAVKYEGIYDIKDGNETIADLIEKAGGLTEYAFKGGTTLHRKIKEEDTLKVRVVLSLKKALKRKSSKYNFVLKNQDSIFIPETQDIVMIEGIYGIESESKTIGVHYNNNRRAKYYINKFAGGFRKGTSRKNTTVEYADGSVKKARNYFVFIHYPKPKIGSTIKTISREEMKKKKGKGFTLDDLISGITSKLMGFVLIFALVKSLGF